MLHFCHAKLNSKIKFDKSTAEARRLNQSLIWQSNNIKYHKVCNATQLWHDSDSNVVLIPCRIKFINFGNVFSGMYIFCVI